MPSWLFALLLTGAHLLSVEAANSFGCGKTSNLTNGVQRLTVNDLDRQYILQLPDNFDNSKPHKLIFAFHWRGADMNNVVSDTTNLQPFYGLLSRSQGSAILVSPDGTNKGWANENGKDVAFVDAMINAIESNLCVDQAQRFAVGFSFGGAMSFALACARASQFRGVAVQAAGIVSGCQGGKDSIAYLGIHGTADNILPFSGGLDMTNQFARNNGCQENTSPAQPRQGSNSFNRTDFTGCRKPVSFIAFDGGHVPAPLGVSSSLAPDAIMDFFNKA